VEDRNECGKVYGIAIRGKLLTAKDANVFLGDLAELFAPCAIKLLSRLLRSRLRITAYTYCKLSCVSFTAQRAFEQLPTLTTPWVLKYILEACPAVLVLSTIIPLTPPG